MPVVTFTAGQVLTAAQMNQIGQDSGWLSLTATQNSWTGTFQYRKIGTLVTLRGSISGGTANQVAATMPTGYLPSAGPYYFPCCDTGSNVFTSILLSAAGGINPRSTTICSLNAVQYYTD